MKTYKNYNQISFGIIAVAVALFGLILLITPNSASAYTTKGYYTITDSDYTTTTTTNNNGSTGYNENATPILTRLSPATVVRNTARSIDVYGDYFTPNSVLKVNGVSKPTNFVSQNHLVTYLAQSDTANLGEQVVTVMNNKTGAQSNARLLSVVNATTTVAKKTTTTAKKATLVRANTSAVAVNPDQVVIIADRGTEIYYLDKSVDSGDVYEDTNTDRTLTANTFFSTGGFMPSTFLQWIVLFILVLLCVYLWRKIYVTDAERNTPLKHH